MKKLIASAILAAGATCAATDAGASAPPDDATQEAVEQAFSDYLDTLDPNGPEFYAQTCSNLDDFWFCFAIDEGVVYASMEQQIMGDEWFAFEAYRFTNADGIPLPGAAMTA